MQVSKEFLEASERIANHFQVPTRVIIDEAGLHVEVGGSWPDLMPSQTICSGDIVEFSREHPRLPLPLN